jgi:hypothetical protein
MLHCNGVGIGRVRYIDNITEPENGLSFPWFFTRESLFDRLMSQDR